MKTDIFGKYLTPHKIALLVLVELYCSFLLPPKHTIPVLTLVMEHLDPSCGNPSTLKHLRSFTSDKASHLPGRTIYDMILKRLWDLQSLDDLISFFASIPGLISRRQSPPVIGRRMLLLSPSSFLGSFVRKCVVEFNNLPLDDVIKLWKGLIGYRNISVPKWLQKNIEITMFNSSMGLETSLDEEMDEKIQNDYEECLSVSDIERLFEFHVSKMQKNKSKLSKEMKERLRKFMEHNVSVPNIVNYVKFLDSWRSGDYRTSFDYLFRYFDYTMRNRDKTGYQYALLDLAMLQADFYCNKEAIWAIQESIDTARENKDHACLNYALSFLTEFQRKETEGITGQGVSDEQVLNYLLLKTKETKMVHLQTVTFLAEAKRALLEEAMIDKAFEMVLKSFNLALESCSTSLISSCILMQSGIWSTLGCSYLCSVLLSIFIKYPSDDVSFEEVVRLRCAYAFHLSKEGKLDESKKLMIETQEIAFKSHKVYHVWSSYYLYQELKQAIRREDLRYAEKIYQQLSSIDVDGDVSFYISVSEIELEARKGNFSLSFDKLSIMQNRVKMSGFEGLYHLMLLLVSAQLYIECQQPLKAFSIASKSIVLATAHHNVSLVIKAILLFSQILLCLEEFFAAYDIVQRFMPKILETSDLEHESIAYFIMAESLFGRYQKDKNLEINIAEQEEISDLLDQALKGFLKLQDVKYENKVLRKKFEFCQRTGRIFEDKLN
ncbi:hypothetical protein PNEG_02278 [Pneumocystis murina B123]|uniref:Anaphase-promoting complex subunit 5 n=1 Tax=Pneumocystis murina (strain B123) TaxID=1069680 RepID=M7NKZ9_PNEMU|nr:hypothetical protein PNEG_02278 [Pneumocystis murina B123]EMR09321.1 hypothetical protein PNEG_02278 [Pneumocystis murina B123]